MITSESDEQQWRITCARVLLCVSVLYYLATLLIFALARSGLHASRAVSQILVLLLLCVSAAIGLSRHRAPSIIAIAIVALVPLAREHRAIQQPDAERDDRWDREVANGLCGRHGTRLQSVARDRVLGRLAVAAAVRWRSSQGGMTIVDTNPAA